MKIADLHIHSKLSDGVRSPEDIVDFVEKKGILDKIYITDHDNIEGSLRGKEHALSRKYNIEVGIGSEISTKDCHLVALDIKKDIKKGMGVVDTAKEIVDQGGFPILAHPMNPFLKMVHISGNKIVELLLKENVPFAIEVNGSLNYQTIPYKNGKILNKSSSISRTNLSAIHLADQNNIPIIGASDAHMLRVIGSAYTLYETNLIDDIKEDKVAYGFIFTNRKDGVPYLIYHTLVPIKTRYRKRISRIIPKVKNKKI
jgi:predicted metal-dependent phosphoesterase TrpH